MIKFQILLCGRVTGNMEFTIGGLIDNCTTEYVGIYLYAFTCIPTHNNHIDNLLWGCQCCCVGCRLKGRDVFHAGIGTHYVTSDKVCELFVIYNSY